MQLPFKGMLRVERDQYGRGYEKNNNNKLEIKGLHVMRRRAGVFFG